jgi:hypothetical protein
MLDLGIYPHECEEPGCTSVVQFDDEPRCFTHSPDSGSFVPGYSARAKEEAADA